MNIHLVRLDPYDPNLGVLVPIVAKRIVEFSREHTKEMDSILVAQAVMVPLWNRDPFILVLAMVNTEGLVVGHAVGAINTDGVNHWLTVSQTQADGAVGDAVKRAITYAQEWVEKDVNPRLRERGQHPVTQMVMVTGKNEKAWERTYGFRVQRRVMVRDLADSAGENEADE